MFQKIVHLKTADAVVTQVEDLILNGLLRSGDRLPPERELATLMDVSRPVLRDALKVLEQRGLLEAQQGGGTFVCDLIGSVFSEPVVQLIQRHPSAIDDYLEFRRGIEGQAASQAALRAAPSDLDIIEDLTSQMQAAHDAADVARESELDVEFHHAIGEAAHNVVLLHTLRSCYRLLENGVFYSRERLFHHPTARGEVLQQHLAIAAAIRSRSPEAARHASESHIDFVRKALAETEELQRRESVADLRRRSRDTRALPT